MTFNIIIADYSNLVRNSVYDDLIDFKVAPSFLQLLVSFRPCIFLHSYHYFF